LHLEVQPVDSRRPDAEQNTIRLRSLGNRQSRLATFGNEQIAPDAFQPLKKHLEVGRLVVNQQDGFHGPLNASHEAFPF
jgi:hypothetical protein